MSDDWVLVLIQKPHNTHAFVFFLFLFPSLVKVIHELDFHIEKMRLFEQILYVLVLNVEVGVKADTDRGRILLGNAI